MLNKIVILGGGTSGWLTAAYLVNNLKLNCEIILVEDSKVGPIGVGEGTQPATASFLYDCGISPSKWMKASNAAFKYGVELVGWNTEPYFVDNDSYLNHYIHDGLFSSHYFANKPHHEFSNWHPAYRLAKANKSPKFSYNFDFNNLIPENSYGAVHFSALEIVKVIKDLIIDKITYIDTKITTVNSDEGNILSLVGECNYTIAGDLYIDCSGFKSILLEESLKEPFISYEDILPCDSAVAIQTDYVDPYTQCHPYTKSTAMSSGWRWTIPIYNRIGNGYVYSSKFISKEDAEKELRDSIGDYTSKANHLKMKCGKHNEVFKGNVCAVGLSAAFVEPLEATGITFTTAIVKNLTKILNLTGGSVDNSVRSAINVGFNSMVDEIVAFIIAHYYFSTKDDTSFWKHISNMKYPEKYLNIFKRIKYSTSVQLEPNSMFNSMQWFQMYHVDSIESETILNKEQEVYAKFILDSTSKKVDLAIDTLDNHYNYLRKWYNE